MKITDTALELLGFTKSSNSDEPVSYWFNYKVEAVSDIDGYVFLIYDFDRNNLVKISDPLKHLHELEKFMDDNEIKMDFSKVYCDEYQMIVSGCMERSTLELKRIANAVRKHAKELFGPTISKEFKVTVHQYDMDSKLEFRVAFRNESTPILNFIKMDRNSGFEYYLDSFTEKEIARLNKR